MQTFRLRGLAEGLAGRSTVTAANLDGVFQQIPALRDASHKLSVNGTTISGFAPCDG